MKSNAVFDQLFAEGLISEETLLKNKSASTGQLVSLSLDLKLLLYLGVSLFMAGTGTLLYKNIDTIGHQFILALIAAVSTGCFYYCFRNKLPYSRFKVTSPGVLFDYVLLLGCCTFLAFLGYWQYQFNIFGQRFGLALFLPMLLLFFCAYFFDHLGILSMAIVGLGAWLGFTVTPLELLSKNDFNDSTIIFTGQGLGLVLLLLSYFSVQQQLKQHFAFTYANFGTHLLLTASLAAVFYFDAFFIAWSLALFAFSVVLYRFAVQNRSFYFILVITGYNYINLTYLMLRSLEATNGAEIGIYLGFLYFIFSGIGLVLFLIHTNKKLKRLVSV